MAHYRGADWTSVQFDWHITKSNLKVSCTVNVVESVVRCAFCNSTPSCLIWLYDSQIVFYCFSQLISQCVVTSKYGDFDTCHPNIEFDRFKFGRHIKFKIVEPVSFCEVSRLIWAYDTPNCHFLSFSSSNRPTATKLQRPKWREALTAQRFRGKADYRRGGLLSTIQVSK